MISSSLRYSSDFEESIEMKSVELLAVGQSKMDSLTSLFTSVAMYTFVLQSYSVFVGVISLSQAVRILQPNIDDLPCLQISRYNIFARPTKRSSTHVEDPLLHACLGQSEAPVHENTSVSPDDVSGDSEGGSATWSRRRLGKVALESFRLVQVTLAPGGRWLELVSSVRRRVLWLLMSVTVNMVRTLIVSLAGLQLPILVPS